MRQRRAKFPLPEPPYRGGNHDKAYAEVEPGCVGS